MCEPVVNVSYLSDQTGKFTSQIFSKLPAGSQLSRIDTLLPLLFLLYCSKAPGTFMMPLLD